MKFRQIQPPGCATLLGITGSAGCATSWLRHPSLEIREKFRNLKKKYRKNAKFQKIQEHFRKIWKCRKHNHEISTNSTSWLRHPPGNHRIRWLRYLLVAPPLPRNSKTFPEIIGKITKFRKIQEKFPKNWKFWKTY